MNDHSDSRVRLQTREKHVYFDDMWVWKNNFVNVNKNPF